jgi:hypothetical protein
MSDLFSEPGQAPVDPWQSPAGIAAPPSAPAGGGGLGFFQAGNLLGADLDPLAPLPHPQSPAGRYVALDYAQDEAEELQQGVQLPPPVVANDQTKTVGGITVTIKADQKDAKDVKAADTSFQLDAGTTPGAETDTKTNKVTKILGPMPVITATIQTRYAPGVSPSAKSGYGRGTTDDDKKKGNTSVGFHESCHRQDYLDYLKAHPLPKFTGKVGMTVDEWQKAVDDYNQAVSDYEDAAAEYSRLQTDEVGNPTKSQFDGKSP